MRNKPINETERRAKRLATPKRLSVFPDFIQWYIDTPKVCCYCGVKEEYLSQYFNTENPQYFIDKDNKARQRGKFLEIERKQTVGKLNSYSEDNVALACYVCNNAKSDFISPANFKPIAQGIHNFWKKVLPEGLGELIFPENSNVWKEVKYDHK